MTLSTGLRRLLLIGVPLAFAILLLFHPLGDEEAVYESLRDHVTRWQIVHVAQLFFIGLIAIAVGLLTQGLEGKAARVSRMALGPFVLFYGAFEAVTGIGTGVLVGYANGLPESERAVAASMIQAYWENPLAANISMAMVIGALAWVTALIAAAIAVRRAGASRSVLVLLVLAGLSFGLSHAPPLGPLRLAFFVAAVILLERSELPHSATQRVG